MWSLYTVKRFWFRKPSMGGLDKLHRLFVQSTAVKFLAKYLYMDIKNTSKNCEYNRIQEKKF